MLYLKNSKGSDANSLVKDIFVTDLLNRTSFLYALLTALRASKATSAHFYKSGEVGLELLMAAEGLEVSVDSTAPEASQALLKKHLVQDLLREAPIENTEVLLFDQVHELNEYISNSRFAQTLNQVKLILVVDLNWSKEGLNSLLDSEHIQREFKVKLIHFGYFSRLSNRGRLGRWLGRLDQSILKHVIPNQIKKGIYIELKHY